jgi:hypothetical protein
MVGSRTLRRPAGRVVGLFAVRTTRLRVRLLDVEPQVVRVLDVPSAATLPELHDVLQAGMGWTDSHLHQFEAGQARYRIPDPDFAADDPDLRDERSATLRDLPETFGYLYDFGDSWHHDIENLGPGGPEPGCVDGQGACPPEDCGGWPGYEEFRDAIAEPTHPEHKHLTSWAGPWTDAFDREGIDALVRATVGQVPGSVRLLLGLLHGGVRLTPGGRLPRVVVRGVQAERPTWSMLDRPASIEEDLPPLAALHDLLRGAGLLRLAHGVLTPTKAAADDLQTIRRLRQVLEPDSFHDILIGVITALLATDGPATSADLAEAALPWLDRWAIGGHPVNTDDLRRQLRYTAPLMQALDLADLGTGMRSDTYRPGPSATTLLPRATALAHYLRQWADTDTQPGRDGTGRG